MYRSPIQRRPPSKWIMIWACACMNKRATLPLATRYRFNSSSDSYTFVGKYSRRFTSVTWFINNLRDQFLFSVAVIVVVIHFVFILLHLAKRNHRRLFNNHRYKFEPVWNPYASISATFLLTQYFSYLYFVCSCVFVYVYVRERSVGVVVNIRWAQPINTIFAVALLMTATNLPWYILTCVYV